MININYPGTTARFGVKFVSAVDILYQLPVLISSAVILILLYLRAVGVYGALYLQVFSRQSVAYSVIAAVFDFRHMTAAINIGFRGQPVALIGKLVADSVGISGVR